ncbi:aspartic peptidase domain-containing protein [Aspergillus unguis]
MRSRISQLLALTGAASTISSVNAVNVPRDLSLSRRANSNTTSHEIKLHSTLYGSRFFAPVTIGGQEFSLLVDTGSSDLFVIEEDFECLDVDSSGQQYEEVSQSECGYNSAAYSLNSSSTYQGISNESFLAAYGAGVANGLMAYEDIEVGGVTVTHQRFGLVNVSTVMQLGGSGVMGLAYPIITSAYENNGTLDEEDQEPYSPLFVSMARRGLVDPYFSLAFDRLESGQETGDGGVMVLGGVADVSTKGNWTTVPAEIYEDADLRAKNGSEVRSYWATTVQKVAYGDGDDSGEYTDSYQTIVDSGAPLTYVPRKVADAWNALFDTPGQWSSVQQGYFVNCDDEVPPFSVQLGGKTFTLDSRDLVLHTGEEYAGVEICISGVTRGQEMQVGEETDDTVELYILGAGFLKSVVAVFDFGKSEMRFAERGEEDSDSDSDDGDNAAGALNVLASSKMVMLLAAVVVFQGLI